MRGHLRKRGKGSWTIVLSLGRDPGTGKYRYKWVTVRGTKRQAEKERTRLLAEMDRNGGVLFDSDMTVGELLDYWLQNYVAHNVRPATAQRYQGIVANHLAPALGPVPLDKLTAGHIQRAYSAMLNDLSPTTVLQHHRVLSQALLRAVKWGFVYRNPATAVEPPRKARAEIRPLSAHEREVFLREASSESQYYALFHTAAFTGMRRSELLGLPWKHVDVERASISVTQVMTFVQGQNVFGEPKSRAGSRLIPLTPSSAIMLRKYQEATRNGDPDALVFAKPDGQPHGPATVSRAFVRVAERAGLVGHRLHDLRHTHATLLLTAGVHPKIVQERLGHSSIATTLDLYSHVMPPVHREAIQRFDDMVNVH